MSNPSANKLIELARRRTQESRSSLAKTMTELFSPDSRSMSDRERVLMFDILRKIVHDVEVSVRRRVAERLADMTDAPSDLIRMMANDTIEVAFPLLNGSPVLRDPDLIEIIQHRTVEHQMAIAMRFSVSAEVSAALAATGNENVIETLLRNQNAEVAESTLAYLVEESRRVDSFQEPLLQRRELGAHLAKRLFLWVSAALRQEIISQFALDEVEVDALLAAAAAEAVVPPCQVTEPSAADRLAEGLDEGDLLDVETLVRALAVGEINLFVSMFARAAGLRDREMRRILFDGNGETLAIVCRAIGIDRDTFATIHQLTTAGLSKRSEPSRAGRHTLMALFNRIKPGEAQRVISRWRLDPEYVAAIESLTGAGAGAGAEDG